MTRSDKPSGAEKTGKQPAWDFDVLAQEVVEKLAHQASRDPRSSKLPAGLYIVATPIGHRGDITLRALGVLSSVDLVLAEDTRVAGGLLRGYGVKTPLAPYHDHNADAVRPGFLGRMQNGAALALVSDAGMPLVADPGFKLVRDAAAQDIPVTVIPGPSAALTGLALAGLPSDAFHFAGFLPSKTMARRTALEKLCLVPGSLIFFESPARLADSLSAMAQILGPRPAAVMRELTKFFEEARRGSLPELAAHYAASPARGEIVIVVGPATDEAAPAEDLDLLLRAACARLSLRDAVAEVAAVTGLPRRDVYARALALTEGIKT